MSRLTSQNDAREGADGSWAGSASTSSTTPGQDSDWRPAHELLPIRDRPHSGRDVPSETELDCLRAKLVARKWDAAVAALKQSEADSAA
jgi:hypothetical protein